MRRRSGTPAKRGTKRAAWPEAERGTRRPAWRVQPETIAAVAALAERLELPAARVADALLTAALSRLSPAQIVELVSKRTK